jgi:hypothetical protein
MMIIRPSYQGTTLGWPRCMASVMVVLALVLQVFVPSGYMIGANAKGGGIAITLCTPKGEVSAILLDDGQVVAREDGNPKPVDDHDIDQPMCPFAAHSSAVQVPLFAPIDLATAFAAVQSDDAAFAIVSPGLGLAAPPPPKTGPPIQA